MSRTLKPLSAPAGTAKQLAEDGIDPRTRLRFLPIAVSAVTFPGVTGGGCAGAAHDPRCRTVGHCTACKATSLLQTAATPQSSQAKALAASSAVCAGLGVLAVGGWKLAGLQASCAALCCALARVPSDLGQGIAHSLLYPAHCSALTAVPRSCIHRLQYKEIAEVSSWDDALALAKQQRVRRPCRVATNKKASQQMLHAGPAAQCGAVSRNLVAGAD